jgi:hypothetical protein
MKNKWKIIAIVFNFSVGTILFMLHLINVGVLFPKSAAIAENVGYEHTVQEVYEEDILPKADGFYEDGNSAIDEKLVGEWIYFDIGDIFAVTYSIEINANKEAAFRPCYDDCGYLGTIEISNDTIYFNGSSGSDHGDIEYIEEKFIIKGDKLLTENGLLLRKAEYNEDGTFIYTAEEQAKYNEIYAKQQEEKAKYDEIYAKQQEEKAKDIMYVFTNYAFLAYLGKYEYAIEISHAEIDEVNSQNELVLKGKMFQSVYHKHSSGNTPRDQIISMATGDKITVGVHDVVFRCPKEELKKEWITLECTGVSVKIRLKLEGDVIRTRLIINGEDRPLEARGRSPF